MLHRQSGRDDERKTADQLTAWGPGHPRTCSQDKRTGGQRRPEHRAYCLCGPVERKKQNGPLPQKQRVHGANKVEVNDIQLAGRARVSADSSDSPPAICKEHEGQDARKTGGTPDTGPVPSISKKRQTGNEERQTESGFL